MNTVDIRLRVSRELKSDAELVFEQMGMSMSEALRVFLTQCVNTGSLPFRPRVKVPNQETLDSFNQIESGEYDAYSLDEFEHYLDELKQK